MPIADGRAVRVLRLWDILSEAGWKVTIVARRSAGSIGSGEIHATENDTGPDGANHAQDGLIIFYDPQHPGRLTNAQIYDVLPTLLARYGIGAPAGLRGKVLAL